jgi:phosphinothricin acetyltransferase
MIGVIDAENQSSVVFHEKFQDGRNYKDSAFKFDRWLHSVLCIDLE